MPRVISGLESLLAAPPKWLRGQRLGLLCNPASVDHRLVHARLRIARRLPGQLAALYSPQHGFCAEKQDNMIASADIRDPLLDLPVFSLYGDTRVPTADMLAPIDLLLVDLQDVGCRVYTFIWTLTYCLEAAARFGKTLAVLDRPNPIGGIRVEGNLLAPDCTSFVGRHPIPMRHGLTIGEMARLLNSEMAIGADLTVVPMRGWQRRMDFADTGLPWVAPSPNMPTPTTAQVYPGQVIWEGTNVSEGRGTTQPFELFGAPFIDPQAVMAIMDEKRLPGVVLRPAAFEPTANKWRGRLCHGFQLHVTHPARLRPFETGMALLQAVIRTAGEDFDWKPPPYEYEYQRRPIDLIIGDRRLRRRLADGVDLSALTSAWSALIVGASAAARKSGSCTDKPERRRHQPPGQQRPTIRPATAGIGAVTSDPRQSGTWACETMSPPDVPWKRMHFRGERVWVAVNPDGSPRIRDAKVAVKYRLENDAQYWVRADAVHPITAGRGPDTAAQLPIDFDGPSLDGCGPGTVCVFAEGVALGNPGLGGIGVVLSYEGREKALASPIGTVTEAAAAIEAIGRGLTEIRSPAHPVRIYSSSGYAYGVLSLGWKAMRHAGRVEAVRRLMSRFSDIRMVWPTAHPEIGPARRARDLAQRAAETAGPPSGRTLAQDPASPRTQ